MMKGGEPEKALTQVELAEKAFRGSPTPETIPDYEHTCWGESVFLADACMDISKIFTSHRTSLLTVLFPPFAVASMNKLGLALNGERSPVKWDRVSALLDKGQKDWDAWVALEKASNE